MNFTIDSRFGMHCKELDTAGNTTIFKRPSFVETSIDSDGEEPQTIFGSLLLGDAEGSRPVGYYVDNRSCVITGCKYGVDTGGVNLCLLNISTAMCPDKAFMVESTKNGKPFFSGIATVGCANPHVFYGLDGRNLGIIPCYAIINGAFGCAENDFRTDNNKGDYKVTCFVQTAEGTPTITYNVKIV